MEDERENESFTSVILDSADEINTIYSEDISDYTITSNYQIDNTLSNANEEVDATTVTTRENRADPTFSLYDAPVTMTQCTLLIGLGGAAPHVIPMNILVYLDHIDLCHFSMTSCYFRHVCKNPELWTELYRKDFIFESLDAMEAGSSTGRLQNWWSFDSRDSPQINRSASVMTAVTSVFPSAQSSALPHLDTLPAMSKAQYMEKYEEMRGREDNSKMEIEQFEQDQQWRRWLRVIEIALDTSQIRLLFPIFLVAGLLSITLFCQKIDGKMDGTRISYWECMAPLLFAIGYFLLSVLITQLLYSRHRLDLDNPHAGGFGGLWLNFESFPRSLMYNEQSQKLVGMPLLVSIMVLSALQIVFVCLKLSLPLVEFDFSWGLVFLPIWCLFFVYCMIPLKYLGQQDASLYIAGCIVFWVPLLIFFIGLSIKLDRKPGLRLALLLVPYWLIEGIILLSALHLLVMGIWGMRNADARIEEQIAVFTITVISVLPFVLFQILLCVRDEEMIKHHHLSVSATEVMIPVLIILGWFCTLSVYFASFHRTAYQQTQIQLDEYSGIKVIVNL